MKRPFTYLNFSLLVIFSLYAISPLSYDAVNNKSGSTLSNPKHSIKLFALSALFDAYESSDDHDDDGPLSASSHDHILLKKKRALRSASAAKLIAQLSTRSEMRLGIPSVRDCIALVPPMQGDSPRCPRGHFSQHSGTSPPSA
jgi:hypothetical protein